MATITELINFHGYNTKEYEEFLQELICFNGDIPFNIEEVDRTQSALVSTINTHLNRSHTRYSGLLMLDKVLPLCSKDILSKYCTLWMSKATQVLESVHSIPQELSISCKVLGRLIIQSKEISEIQKQVSMQNVKQLVNAIGNLSPEKKCGPVYYLIAVLLLQYPEVCERFQMSIKKIILLQIDSEQENLVNSSARCYALLAKATARSFKPPASKPTCTNWTYNQALICNSLHAIMDELFSNLMELENVNIGDELELPNISKENIIQFYFKQKQRFLNLCSYLCCMLRGFDKKNSVLPNEILKVLYRGLAVRPSNIKNQNSIGEQMLYLIVPKLHVGLFDVLNALINGFKEQLIPFGSSILQLFLQTLQWTERILENQTTISGNRPFRNVRISVYKCLASWLSNTNSMSGIETVADEYLPSILKDIVPERDRVSLTIQKTENLSKRALKRLRDSQYEKGAHLSNGIGSSKEYSLDVDICKGALVALQNIFFNAGSLLKQIFFKTTQNIIIPLLYDCYLSSVEQKFYKDNTQCRLLLFRVLRAVQMNPHSLVPLPTQYSVEIFELALSDGNLLITQEAKIALAELEKIVHPYAPSIELAQMEIVQKEFVADSPRVEHTETLEDTSPPDTEDSIDNEMAPSSNKKVKITNSHPNESTESAVENVSVLNTSQTMEIELHLGETSECLPEESDSATNGERCTQELSEPLTTDSTNLASSASHVVKENIDTQMEKLDALEETNTNPKSNSEMTVADRAHLSIEKETEEEELLQCFQDVTNDDNLVHESDVL